ncbi:MAG: MBL fold metallo-hydrolase [Burkholderiales bacterium]|nr:MBL fold metallo-hydrolase [Burkholderiales bacterium]
MIAGRNAQLAWFLFVAFAVQAGFVSAASVTLPVLVPQKVAPDIYLVQGKAGVASQENRGFNSNAGFVVTRDGVVVIDALGTAALGEAMVVAIRNVADKPIRKVIVTHYHADHFYGLQAFKKAGAEVWAHAAAREYLDGGEGAARLVQRRADLAPWVDESTQLIPADVWIEGNRSFTLGGTQFDIIHLGPAHSPEDVIIVVGKSGVIFTGDILFTGRIPFVGEADSKRWLQTFSKLIALKPHTMITGHGAPSRNPAADLTLTRDYLIYIRQTMGKAVEDFVPFDEAYAKTDWSRFAKLPAFEAANRINAYGTYLLMEKESLSK